MAKKKSKSKAKQSANPPVPETISSEVIAAAFSSMIQPKLMKVCRLCESKDGPFLNIFDADKVTARKIDELMPFGIAENDDLPHKICFRCSAKLEELYEFIQKCIKTQENLRMAIGKTGSFVIKTKTRTVWEEKLNKTNMSNDDICDALIKKAMEGIKDMPIKPLSDEEPTPPSKRITRSDQTASKKESTSSEDNDDMEINLKQVKLTLEKFDSKPLTNKPIKSNNEEVTPPISNKTSQIEKKPSESKLKSKSCSLINNLSFEEESKPSENVEKVVKNKQKPFNIMDHISMIKVNGVGVLFQCKLCNRNFLKKEVVESHNCAKNGIPKIEIPKVVPVPEPPKVSTVKYIKIDNDVKTSLSWRSYKMDTDLNESTDSKSSSCKIAKEEEIIQSAPKVKPKARAGPASKTRRIGNTNSIDLDIPIQGPTPAALETAIPQLPSLQMPSEPKLNGRYKLVPGPNNIFTLVEDSFGIPITSPDEDHQKLSKKRKSDEVNNVEIKSKERKKDSREKEKPPVTIEAEVEQKPYPVGLFQTGGHPARLYPVTIAATPPVPFTTPAMKKQSYTIVQTGNPSKLLISTKAIAPPEEVPKKRQRKSKPDVRQNVESKEPFTVTLEDVAPPKDSGFFTFINVDPLLQPSYVLPTDNIIQESQISTSTSVVRNLPESSKESKDKDKYACNMCGEIFSREKKLLTHIQSHYTQMDEEDQLRAEKSSKKRGKK